MNESASIGSGVVPLEDDEMTVLEVSLISANIFSASLLFCTPTALFSFMFASLPLSVSIRKATALLILLLGKAMLR